MQRLPIDPRISAVMTRDVVAMGPQTGVQAAARLLAENNISGAPVVTRDGRAVGFVSLSDLAGAEDRTSVPTGADDDNALPTEGWIPEESAEGEILDPFVEDIMTPDIYLIEEDRPVSEAARMMVRLRIHRLLVTRDLQLVGIVSTLDLLRGLVGEPATGVIEALELDSRTG